MRELKSGPRIYFLMKFNDKNMALKYKKYNENLEQVVEKLHQELGVNSIPVNLEIVTEKLGIRVKTAPSEEFSGLLLRKNDTAMIGVNNEESQVRQRFTIAHELGHFFLHKTKDTFVDYRDNKINNSSEFVRTDAEKQANMFAATFLMPKGYLISDIKKMAKLEISELEIGKLAKKYDVSRDAMNYRILNLGLSKGI